MKIKVAYTITVIFLIAGLLWIAFINRLFLNQLQLSPYSTFLIILLNLLFVLLSGLLVLILIKRTENKINILIKNISNKDVELTQLTKEQKKLIRKLKKAEGIFETVVRKLPTGIIVFTKNLDFYTINEKITEISGYTEEDIPNVKTALKKALPDPIYRANIRKIFIQDYKNQLKSNSEIEPRLVRIACKNGFTKIVEIKFLNYDNFIFVSVTDQTQIIEAQKSYEKTKENLLKFFEQTPLPTVFYDLKGNIVQVNNAWRNLWILENEEDVIKNYNLLEDEQSFENGYIEAFQKALRGEIVELEPVLYKPESSNIIGRNRWIKSKVFPIINEFSLIKYIVFQHEDITTQKESELALIESENRFRQLVENSPSYVFRFTTKLILTYISPIALKELKISEDFLGKEITSLYPENKIEEFQNIIKQLLRKKEKVYITTYNIIDGQTKIIYWDFIPEITSLGEINSIIGIARDITEEKIYQEKIESLKNFYENIIEHASNAFLVLDEGNNIKYFNNAFEQIVNVNPNAKFLKELNPQLVTQIEPYFEQIKNVKDIVNFELTLTLDKDYFFLCGLSPIFKDSVFSGAILTLFDNTINKNFENAITQITVGGSSKLGKLFFDTIVMQLSDILKADITFIGEIIPGEKVRTISVCSDNEITDNFEYSLKNTPCNDVTASDVCVFPSKVAELYPKDYLLKEMGIEGYVGVSLVDSYNNPIGIVVALYKEETEDSNFIKNILKLFASRISSEIERIKKEEDLKKLSDKLIDKNKELEQIIYVSSHDLRSPLINVEGFSKEIINSLSELKEILNEIKIDENLKSKLDFIINTDIPESTRIIGKSVTQMNYLLKSLLKLSRLGRESLEFAEIDVNSLLTDIVRNYEHPLNESGINIEIGNLPSCYSDKSQLFHIFSNLVENAIKYSDSKKENKWIKLLGKTDNYFAIYEIEDNGVGIEKTKFDKIFEIFYRLNNKGTKGEGIGLTIVKKSLSRIGGKIKVESELGSGTKFLVYIPLTAEILRREIDFS